MKYVAMPQQTCDWLLAHPSILAALHEVLISGEVGALTRSEFSQGPLRMIGGDDQGLLTIWNREYLSGTGEESWGLFRLEGPMGLKSHLEINHRSTREIVDLAFFVIQQTTDLFGPDFPDFKKAEVGLSNSQKALAAPPIIVKCNEDAKSFGRFVVKTVQKLRAKNVRQIAVVCHGETYWDELHREFLASRLPLHILSQRGERVTPDQPLVILSRPAYIGGQEFDAVVLVGLEQGLVPPRIVDNDALAAAIEQQVLRDMYLSITRARTRLIVVINQDALPNSIVESAKSQSLISVGTVS